MSAPDRCFALFLVTNVKIKSSIFDASFIFLKCMWTSLWRKRLFVNKFVPSCALALSGWTHDGGEPVEPLPAGTQRIHSMNQYEELTHLWNDWGWTQRVFLSTAIGFCSQLLSVTHLLIFNTHNLLPWADPAKTTRPGWSWTQKADTTMK